MQTYLPLYTVCLTVGLALTTDLRSGKIPNVLTITSLVCGLLFHTLWGNGMAWSITGIVLGFVVFLLPFLCGGMGGGDVKLFAALGAWLGWRDVLLATLLTAIAGSGIALILLVRNNGRWDGLNQILFALRTRHFKSLPASGRFPYTIPTAIGVVAVLCRSWT